MREASLVGRLEQSRPERGMDPHRRTDYVAADLVRSHLRVFRSSHSVQLLSTF